MIEQVIKSTLLEYVVFQTHNFPVRHKLIECHTSLLFLSSIEGNLLCTWTFLKAFIHHSNSAMNSQQSLRRRKSSLKNMSAPKSNKSVTFGSPLSDQRFAVAYAKCNVFINSYEKLPLDTTAPPPRKALFGLEPPPFLDGKEQEDYIKECLSKSLQVCSVVIQATCLLFRLELVDTLNLDRTSVSRGTMDRWARLSISPRSEHF